MQIDGAADQRAAHAGHAIDQIPQPIGFVNDDLGVFFQSLFFQLSLQQLGGAAQSAKGVLDFMRESSHDGTVRSLPIEKAFFSGKPQPSIDLRKLDKKRGLARIRCAMSACGIS